MANVSSRAVQREKWAMDAVGFERSLGTWCVRSRPADLTTTAPISPTTTLLTIPSQNPLYAPSKPHTAAFTADSIMLLDDSVVESQRSASTCGRPSFEGRPVCLCTVARRPEPPPQTRLLTDPATWVT